MHHERPHPASSLLLDGHDALERLLVDPARNAELTSLFTLARDLDVRAEDLGGAIEDLAGFDAERWAEASQHPTGTAAFRARAHQQARRLQQAGLPAQVAFLLYRMGNTQAREQMAMWARRLPLKAAIPILQDCRFLNPVTDSRS